MPDNTQKPGADEHIEMPDDPTVRDAQHEKELAKRGLDTYKELADHYKSLYVALHDHEYTGWVKGVNLHDYDHLNTKAELKRALVYLLKAREDEVHLNEHYASEVEGLTYDKLAERYKDLYKDVHKDTPLEHHYDGKDLTKIRQLDTPEELRLATMRLMWERDKQMPMRENHPAAPGGEPNLEPPDAPVPNFEDGMSYKHLDDPFKVKTFWEWHREQLEM
jgi:hypothetical protein